MGGGVGTAILGSSVQIRISRAVYRFLRVLCWAVAHITDDILCRERCEHVGVRAGWDCQLIAVIQWSITKVRMHMGDNYHKLLLLLCYKHINIFVL